MTGIEYDDLRWLHLLWVVIGVAALGVYGVWQRRRALRMFADLRLLRFGDGARTSQSLGATAAPGSEPSVGRTPAPLGWTRPLVRLALVVVCLTLLVAAIIGPRSGETEQVIRQRGIDVIVLLDVSRSMLAQDLRPNRLERAKLAIRDDLLPALGGDRIGLITFAGSANLKCPLTSDYGFFRLALDDVDTSSSPRGGTLIGDAIKEARKCFMNTGDTHKLVILITDGEDQDSDPVGEATKMWADDKIPLVSIALGDDREGARIPLPSGAGEDYLKYKGEVVRSRAQFRDLEQIAHLSPFHGLVKAGTKNFDLGQLYKDTISKVIIEKNREDRQKVQKPSQYWWPAAAALLVLLVDSFLRDGPASATAAALAKRERRSGVAA